MPVVKVFLNVHHHLEDHPSHFPSIEVDEIPGWEANPLVEMRKDGIEAYIGKEETEMQRETSETAFDNVAFVPLAEVPPHDAGVCFRVLGTRHVGVFFEHTDDPAVHEQR